MRCLLGVDIGGTFTDFVAYDADAKRVHVWKTLTSAGDPVAGLLRGLEEFEHRDTIDHIRIGTTVATNALLERKVAPVAYVTTAGFRDVPFIQRGHRRYHYNLRWVKPKPLVKRQHCYEVAERVGSDGEVVIPLDEAQVRSLGAMLAGLPDIEAVAVVLLFSYVNPSHEIRIKQILSEVAPRLPVSISYDVLPRWKEYERATTTIADAALKPIVSRQLRAILDQLREGGITAKVAAIRSNGGEMTLDAAAEAPVHLALSGPTGGVVAAKHLAKLAGLDSLVTLDMGGTSTDCATIKNGQESFTTNFEIDWGVPIQIPMIDVRTIGAGGGSIAWIDKGGMLRVGPQSSGSKPGPACYGHGGSEPTVTDANLLLGRINPHNFLGGRMPLDVEAARRSMQQLATRIGRTVTETAMAIVHIANSNMQGALRSVLVERGHDPRDFTLMAFGGAGPLHASELISDMEFRAGIVPRHPGQLSAYGFTLTDARVDRQRTTQFVSIRFDRTRATQLLREVVAEAVADLNLQGYGEGIDVFRSLEMRYFGQNYELELPVSFADFGEESALQLWQQFHAAHKARFGFDIPGEVIEIVNFSVTAIARTEKPDFETLEESQGVPEPVGRRRVHFSDGEHDAAIFDRDRLAAGHRIVGPALIEEAASVTVLGPIHAAVIDRYGSILITPRAP